MDLDYNEVFGVKQFDVVVGNPPFSDGTHAAKPIYINFIIKSLCLAKKHVLLITPATWAATGFKKTKAMVFMNGLKKFVFISNYFNEIKMALCWFHCNLAYNNTIVDVTFSSGHKSQFNIKHDENIIDYKDPALFSFIKKYGTKEHFKLKKTNIHKASYHNQSDTGTEMLFALGKNGYKTIKVDANANEDPDIQNYRLVFGEYRRGAIAIVPPGTIVPNTFYYLCFESIEDAKKMFDYFMSPVVRWVVTKTHTTRTFCSASLKCVPFRKANDDKTFVLSNDMKKSIKNIGDAIPY